jgi:hypothetical protein
MAEFSRESDAALRKQALHIASELPHDPGQARRVVAYVTELLAWESEGEPERKERPGAVVARLFAVEPDPAA